MSEEDLKDISSRIAWKVAGWLIFFKLMLLMLYLNFVEPHQEKGPKAVASAVSACVLEKLPKTERARFEAGSPPQ